MSEECFQHLVESVPQRIIAVLKEKGGLAMVPNKVASLWFTLHFSRVDLTPVDGKGSLC